LPDVVEFGCDINNSFVNAIISIDTSSVVTGGSEDYVLVELYQDVDNSGDLTTGDVEITTVDSSSAPQYDFTVTDPAGGDYFVRVVDSEGCDAFSGVVTVMSYNALDEIDVNITTPYSCVSDEFIEITYTSVSGNYEDAIVTILNPDGSVYQSQTFTSVDEGIVVANTIGLELPTGESSIIYTIRVESSLSGCYIETGHVIDALPSYIASIVLNDALACDPLDASTEVTVSIDNIGDSYTGDYTYDVYDAGTATTPPVSPTGLAVLSSSGENGDASIIGLTEGRYYVRITMEEYPECVFNSEIFEIELPDVEDITSTEEVFPVSCIGVADGIVDITDVQGGYGSYEYALVPGTDTSTTPADAAFDTIDFFEDLAAGPYVLWIRDFNGCQMMPPKELQILNPDVVDFDLDKEDNACVTATGVIIVENLTGGSGTYDITVTGNTSTDVFTASTTITATMTNTSVKIPVIEADTYTVSVVDGINNCDPVTDTITINEELTLAVNPIKGLDCTTTPDATFEIIVNTGSGNYSYEVLDSTNTVVESGNITANGTAVTFTILDDATEGAGDYTVEVTDIGSSCTKDQSVTVEEKVFPLFTAMASVNNTCYGSNGGVILLTPTINPVTPLTYEISGTLTGGGTYSAIIPDTDFAGSNQFSDLAPGDYIITAIGINDCETDSQVIEIRELEEITFNTSVVEFGCTTGNVTDVATVSVINPDGGSGAYDSIRFEFTPNGGGTVESQDSSLLTFSTNNTLGGTVDIIVYDDEGCISDVVTETILPFEELSVPTVTQTQAIDCATGESIEVTYTPASATNVEFTVEGMINDTSFIETNNTGVFTDLATDDYLVSVTNLDTGCVNSTIYTVDPEPVFALSVTVNNLCTGEDNGTITFDFSDSTPYAGNYDYEIFQVGTPTATAVASGNSSNETTVNDLEPGTYYVQLVLDDSPYCTVISQEVDLEEAPTQLTITGLDITNINCNATGGAVTVTAEGGWPGAYEYQLVKTDVTPTVTIPGSSNIFSDLEAGDYEITVVDSEMCIATDTFTIATPIEPFDVTTSVTQNLCKGGNTASIEITVVNGGYGQGIATNYNYTIRNVDLNEDESRFETSNIFSNLLAGEYEIKVYDVTPGENTLGCVHTLRENIVDNELVSVVASTDDIVTCLDEDVAVDLTGSGGTGTGYTFTVSNDPDVVGTPFASGDIVGLGTHYFVAFDSNGCPSEPFRLDVEPVEDLEAELVVNNGFISCNGDANGILSATATGGLGNYMYSLLVDTNDDGMMDSTIMGPQESNTFAGLDIGLYQIEVTSEDCIALTGTYEITQNEAIEASPTVTHTSCIDATDGVITMGVTGGSGIFTYNISTEPPTKFQESNVFENLAPGLYTITVFDDLGCFVIIEDIEVEAPEEIEVSFVSLTQQTCIDDPAPSAEIAISGGVTPYVISLNNVPHSDVTATGNFTASGAEIYELTNLPVPTDGNNLTLVVFVASESNTDCITVLDERLVIEPPVDLQLEVITEPLCDGTTNLIATVAEQYADQVVYSISGPEVISPNDTGVFSITQEGLYVVTATPVDPAIESCAVPSEETFVRVYEEIVIEIDDSQQNFVIVNASGGVGPYQYNIDGIGFTTDNEFIISQTREYQVIVRDSRGCEQTLVFEGVFVPIEIPNLFTPNGDTVNDTWYPLKVEDYHDVTVYIYDRYGRKLQVYQGPKGSHGGWDGTYEGRPLPSGDYWYTIVYKERTGEEKQLMGHFTLYR